MSILDEMAAALYERSIPDALGSRWPDEAPPAWITCDDPCVLVNVLAPTDPSRGTRVAVASARIAMTRLAPDDQSIANAALLAAQAWADGRGDPDTCSSVARKAIDRARSLAELDACAMYSAAHAAYAAAAAAKGSRSGAAEHAWRAVAASVTDVYDDDHMCRLELHRRLPLAVLIRDAWSCPTLDDLSRPLA